LVQGREIKLSRIHSVLFGLDLRIVVQFGIYYVVVRLELML